MTLLVQRTFSRQKGPQTTGVKDSQGFTPLNEGEKRRPTSRGQRGALLLGQPAEGKGHLRGCKDVRDTHAPFLSIPHASFSTSNACTVGREVTLGHPLHMGSHVRVYFGFLPFSPSSHGPTETGEARQLPQGRKGHACTLPFHPPCLVLDK